MKAPFDYHDIPLVAMSKEVPRPAMEAVQGRGEAFFDRPGRRRVVLGMFAVGGGVALNALSWLPPARLRSARAHHATYSKHPDYCGGRDYSNQPCSNARTGSGYCAGNGWHRHDSVNAGGGRTKVHWVDESRCWGYNAWTWNSGGQRWRCSDGNVKYIAGGQLVEGPYHTVCAATY